MCSGSSSGGDDSSYVPEAPPMPVMPEVPKSAEPLKQADKNMSSAASDAKRKASAIGMGNTNATTPLGIIGAPATQQKKLLGQ